ncbi:hypothetical protein O9H85_00780 [Paenibacillus filicis]|uniref:Uncharacterized protein n=2 Tax=Paenibacillus gyeongsangnamensis TaxID=3388067 RepID=A0ABT4Q2D8_9BACL|nr:hypothetical protein [Paenibacillus filicis]MCZ8510991.1 hypothetical protein [Paenibacillus filicis]
MRTFRKAVTYGGDIYQLEYETYLHHYRKWKEFNGKSAFPISEKSIQSIEIDVKINHTGMMKKICNEAAKGDETAPPDGASLMVKAKH